MTFTISLYTLRQKVKWFALPKVTPTDFSHYGTVLGSMEDMDENSRLSLLDLRLH